MQKVISDIILLLIIIDPLGNIPIFVNLLKNINYKRRYIIIIREMIFSLFIMFFFLFFGEKILLILNLEYEIISISGGIILFLISLKMIFPKYKKNNIIENNEPFLVPIAVPLIAGPSILSSLIIFSHKYKENIKYVIFILFISWFISLLILLLSNFLIKFLKKQGIIIFERIMGLILIMISIKMFFHGIKLYFIKI